MISIYYSWCWWNQEFEIYPPCLYNMSYGSPYQFYANYSLFRNSRLLILLTVSRNVVYLCWVFIVVLMIILVIFFSGDQSQLKPAESTLEYHRRGYYAYARYTKTSTQNLQSSTRMGANLITPDSKSSRRRSCHWSAALACSNPTSIRKVVIEYKLYWCLPYHQRLTYTSDNNFLDSLD